ncbi:MAG: glycine betaine ABC transporter substrate-binding protein [Acidimicrobiales bacterium]
MNTSRRSWRALAVLASFGLLIAACGSDDDGGDEGGGASEGGGEFAELDLSGVSISVGSKDFTEQLVLGEMLVQSFEAAGADVENRVNLGGTQVNRQALLEGEIDVYAEYNGTGWTEHLGNESPSDDPETLTEAVREQDLADNSIQWLSRSPFNNTYGFATGPDLTDENGGAFDIDTMAAYLEDNSDAIVCMESEFPDRSDGLILFEDATGYTIPEGQINIIDTNLIYTETAQGNCDFGEIFTTDGRISELDLSIVDDKGTFIIYNVSVNVRDELYQENTDAFDTIAERMLEGLDNDTMAELNRRVSVGGEDPDAVARDYLQENGLI